MADKLSRRDFMKKAELTIAGGSLAGIGGLVGGNRHLSRLIAAYWQEMSRNHCAAAPVPDTVRQPCSLGLAEQNRRKFSQPTDLSQCVRDWERRRKRLWYSGMSGFWIKKV